MGILEPTKTHDETRQFILLSGGINIVMFWLCYLCFMTQFIG